ncbi:MAG: CPBP family intramembrane metalloprotease, partial [Crocinitomicaceae bacterium]|nr:CPBP family intramembrane metalloprotease [Crocinitomicaceae bacterium]
MNWRQIPGVQIFGLLLLVILGLAVVGTILFTLLYAVFGDTTVEKIDSNDLNTFYLLAFSGQLGILITGFFGFLRIFKLKARSEIQTKKFNWIFFFGSFVALILVWLPVTGAELINYWLIEQFPASGFLEAQKELEGIYLNAFNPEKVKYYPYAIFIFALLPAISEELIFRGLLLKKLMESSEGKTHFAVIVTALLFAAIHVQPWNLLPMIIMGILLGYVYVYTKDIRYLYLIQISYPTRR